MFQLDPQSQPEPFLQHLYFVLYEAVHSVQNFGRRGKGDIGVGDRVVTRESKPQTPHDIVSCSDRKVMLEVHIDSLTVIVEEGVVSDVPVV